MTKPLALPPQSQHASIRRGALMMTGAAASFALMMAIVRKVSVEIHPLETAFFRNLLGLMFMAPWLLKAGFGVLRTGRFRVHVLRAAFGLGSMWSLFMALALLPLAEVTALSFTAPLFGTMGAAMFFGERVRIHRWTATIVGLIGAMVVLRPGIEAVQPASLIALGSAVLMAAAMLSVKSLSRTEHPNAIIIMMGVLMTPASLVPALFVWTWPSAEAWGWLMVMGIAATTGQVCLTRAFAAADASALLPFDFSRLVFATAIGFVIFGEIPTVWTWLGAGIIIAANVYIAHREARRNRSAPPADRAYA
ncbi:MAG: DMT family transporter [Rhodospirillales bacterium]